MLSLRIGGVPEHFNLPWRLAIEEGIFAQKQIDLQWTDHAGGTGSLMQALQEKHLDLAIALTEGAVAHIIQGQEAALLKIYVQSPLHWGVYVAAQSPYQHIEELQGKPYAFRRFGSGSHLMAYVHAQELGWTLEKSAFVLLKDLHGMRQGLQEGKADLFMWEKAMTQPYVNSGELRHIATCITPWPCFVLVVRRAIYAQAPEAIAQICEAINGYCKNFKQREGLSALVAARYQLPLRDVEQWLSETEWASDNQVPEAMLEEVVARLQQLQLIPQEANFKDLIISLSNKSV